MALGYFFFDRMIDVSRRDRCILQQVYGYFYNVAEVLAKRLEILTSKSSVVHVLNVSVTLNVKMQYSALFSQIFVRNPYICL